MLSWYVEDNKVLHIEENMNTRLIEAIAEHFVELTLLRRENHKFMEMDIES